MVSLVSIVALGFFLGMRHATDPDHVIAVSTIVGQKLGENRPDLAERATWTAMFMAMGYTGLCAVLYLIVRSG